MWVCTSFGVLMPGLRPANTLPEGDNRVLQVRARRKKDLDILREKYMGDELGDSLQLEHTDYEWRAYCTLEAWGRALAKIAMDIDYVKFKETAENKFHDKQLHDLYLSMWGSIAHHLSEPGHMESYFSGGWTSTVGKYGTTYGGTGNFSTGKKGKHRSAGTRSYRKGSGYAATGTGYPEYSPDLDPATYLGNKPWWADAEGDGYTYPGYKDDDDLGLYGDLVDRGVIVESLRTKQTEDSFDSLLSALEMMDPYDRPALKQNGDIDHMYCEHGISKSAKKRCRARWRRIARQSHNKVREALAK